MKNPKSMVQELEDAEMFVIQTSGVGFYVAHLTGETIQGVPVVRELFYFQGRAELERHLTGVSERKTSKHQTPTDRC